MIIFSRINKFKNIFEKNDIILVNHIDILIKFIYTIMGIFIDANGKFKY